MPWGLLPELFFAEGFFARSSTGIIPDEDNGLPPARAFQRVITDLQRVGYVETAEEKSNRHLKNIQEFVGPRLAEMTTADRKALRIWNSEATTKADRVVRPSR